jgi:hypothetical protein
MECHLLRRKEKQKLLKLKIKWNKCDTYIYRFTIADGVNNMLSKKVLFWIGWLNFYAMLLEELL